MDSPDSYLIPDSTPCGKRLFSIGEEVVQEPENPPLTRYRTQSSQATLLDDVLGPLWESPKTAQGSSGSEPRSVEKLLELRDSDPDGLKQMSNDELLSLLIEKHLKVSQLEKSLKDELRSVHLRRAWLEKAAQNSMKNIPYSRYDYSFVSNSCCENVIGYIPMPLGYAGPLVVNGHQYFVPMATTEGCLVASTNRGCAALSKCQEGVKSFVYEDKMTRGPVVRFSSAAEGLNLKKWLENMDNFLLLKQKFDSTSRFAKLKSIRVKPAGCYVFLRLSAQTGDAMGMNMVSKGTEQVMHVLKRFFTNMEILSLSGNFCTDKKPAALNWIEGRGKSVISEATVPAPVVQSALKTTVDQLVELNTAKNLVGSAVAGTLGGNNAHSANIVTAIFLATGQDAAQNISSSNCITLLERSPEGDLHISCTMPSLEVGTVGGGTILPAQHACLEMLGCAGANHGKPGANATRLAEIICATVLAGELSLLAALTTGDLVKSHIKMNRSRINLKALSETPRPVKSSQGDSSLNLLPELPVQLTELAQRTLKGSHADCSNIL